MTPQPNSAQRVLILALILIGVGIVGFFGFRTVRAFREFREHHPPPPFATPYLETDVNLIRDWMTIPFISKMYHVKPHSLFEALEIPEQGNHDKSLRQLNEEYYPQDEGVVLDKVKAAVQNALANRPQPIGPETPIVP